MARRAASIWRAVRRPRAMALSPYSPKATLLPRVAMPLLRPFCCLRYFVLAGCSILDSWFLRHAPDRGLGLGCGFCGFAGGFLDLGFGLGRFTCFGSALRRGPLARTRCRLGLGLGAGFGL